MREMGIKHMKTVQINTKLGSLFSLVTGENLFLLGYMIYMGRAVWTSTMFPFPDGLRTIILLTALVLIGIKIVFFDRYSFMQILGIIALILCAGAVMVSSRYLNAVFWIFLVMGSKDVDFGKILKIYLIVAGSIVFLAVCSSLIGVIENLQYTTSGRGTRNSFGIVYTTDFAAYIFFLLLVYFYLKGPALTFWHYAAAVAASGLVYYFCKARVDSVCILLVALIFGIHGFMVHTKYAFPRIRRAWQWLWRTWGVVSMPFWAAVSILATRLFDQENRAFSEINELFSGRLYLGQKGWDDFGLSLFGQTIDMVGFGGSIERPDNYFFIDCSYMNVMLRYGIVFLVVLVGVYTICCYKNRKDMYFLFAIALVSLNCVIAHHIFEVSYNPFAYALLAVHLGSKEKESVLWHALEKRR